MFFIRGTIVLYRLLYYIILDYYTIFFNDWHTSWFVRSFVAPFHLPQQRRYWMPDNCTGGGIMWSHASGLG